MLVLGCVVESYMMCHPDRYACVTTSPRLCDLQIHANPQKRSRHMLHVLLVASAATPCTKNTHHNNTWQELLGVLRF